MLANYLILSSNEEISDKFRLLYVFILKFLQDFHHIFTWVSQTYFRTFLNVFLKSLQNFRQDYFYFSQHLPEIYLLFFLRYVLQNFRKIFTNFWKLSPEFSRFLKKYFFTLFPILYR